jgi:hypothetical protein
MKSTMSVSEYRALTTKGKAKYRNTPCLADGMRFASKLERDRYIELKWLKARGEIKWFTRQVPLYLPGGVIYRMDFLIVHESGVSCEDCKGIMTPVSALKIRQVEEIYGIKIEIIRKVAVRSA